MSKDNKKQEQDAQENAPETGAEHGAGASAEASNTQADTPAAEPKAEVEPTAEDIIEKLNAEVGNLKDQLLRARAETENVRRRGDKDRAEATAYASTGFARDMLTVIDNFNRAQSVLPEEIAEDLKAYVEGVDLTHRELLKIFERHGITLIDPALGEKFDSNLHQAMFEMPSDEYGPGTIANVVAQGYLIKDRLLRAAMVGVVKK